MTYGEPRFTTLPPTVVQVHGQQVLHGDNITMRSSNGKIFRVTCHLFGEFTGDPAQGPVTRSVDVFFDLA